MRVILHRDLSPTAEGRALAEIQGLMELEYELAEREGATSALLHIRPEGLSYLDSQPRRRAAARAALLELLASLPRSRDLLALERQGAWCVLLARSQPGEAEDFARALLEGARHLLPAGEAAALRIPVAIGVAESQPDQELFFETLVRVAAEGAEVASQSGGETVVHTQLYALHQKKLERELPAAKPPHKGKVTVEEPAANWEAAGVTAEPRAEQVLTSAPAMPAPSAEALDARARELAEQWTSAAIGSRLEEQRSEHERELDLMRRRIQKLTTELQATESSLQALARTRGSDQGKASIFREVQGLDSGDREYTAKLALLGEILEENLRMRRTLRAG